MNTHRWHFYGHQGRGFFACLEVSLSLYMVQHLSFCLLLHTFLVILSWRSTNDCSHGFHSSLCSHRPLGSPCGSWPDCTLARVAIWGALAVQPFCLSSPGLGIAPSSNTSSRSCHTWQQARICWEPELSRGCHTATTGDASIWKRQGSSSPLAESHAWGIKLAGLKLTLIRFHLCAINLVVSWGSSSGWFFLGKYVVKWFWKWK